jgi:hypothetical protein
MHQPIDSDYFAAPKGLLEHYFITEGVSSITVFLYNIKGRLVILPIVWPVSAQ